MESKLQGVVIQGAVCDTDHLSGPGAGHVHRQPGQGPVVPDAARSDQRGAADRPQASTAHLRLQQVHPTSKFLHVQFPLLNR